ncbi:MAG: hypothetical protein RIS31_527 [Actinomycetota bacterium]
MIILLDADTCSYLIRQIPAVLKRCQEHMDAGDIIGISSITAFELRYGIETKQPRVDAETFLVDLVENVKVHPFGIEAGFQAALIRADQAKKGLPSGFYDPMLAGHAVALNAQLVTNNTKHFKDVPGLLLANWME